MNENTTTLDSLDSIIGITINTLHQWNLIGNEETLWALTGIYILGLVMMLVEVIPVIIQLKKEGWFSKLRRYILFFVTSAVIWDSYQNISDVIDAFKWN